MKVWYIILLVVFILKFNDVSSANCIRLNNLDIPGNDIGGVYSSSADDCCNKCYNKWNCIVWTRSIYGTCWMKTKISSIRSYNGVVSGVMAGRTILAGGGIMDTIGGGTCAPNQRYPNKDSAGNDLHSAMISLKQESDCCQLCSSWKDSCKGYVWNHASNTCWLKKAIGTLQSLSIADVGVLSGSAPVTPSPTIGDIFIACTPNERKTNTDSAGNDLHSVAYSLNSESECCQKCKGRSDCVAYVWNYAANQCWLKRALGTLKPISIANLGIVRGSAPAPVTSAPPTSIGCSCGCPKYEPIGEVAGIIGGQVAKEYSWPWQIWLTISMGGGNYITCGGSLISDRWVLTAAHCLNSAKPVSDYTVWVGMFKTWQPDAKASVASVHPYPEYPDWPTIKVHNRPYIGGKDIALIKLTAPVTFNDKVQKVCIPKEDSAQVTPGTKMTVTGWGRTSLYHGQTSDVLKQATLQIKRHSSCSEKEICFPGPKSGQSSFKGDSGGPLVRKKGGNWFQHGIVSGGSSSSTGEDLAVFVRVSAHCDWIRQITGISICK